jgi:LacI family transcriptional regulator
MSSRRKGKIPENPPAIAFVTTSDTANGWMRMYNAKEFHRGCQTVASMLGIHLEHFWIGDKLITPARLNQILYSRGILGAIFLPTGIHREKVNHHWENIAAVSYGIYEMDPSFDQVKADIYGNMEQTLRILKGMGFQRIGYVMDIPFPYDLDNQWYAAYRMYRDKVTPEHRLQPYLEAVPSEGGFQAWFREQQPEVVICKDQEKVNSWLGKMGLRVPDNVSLSSLGTTASGKAFSGMMENAAMSGEMAMEILLDRIHRNQFGPPGAPRHVTLRGQWNPGMTLQPPGSNP